MSQTFNLYNTTAALYDYDNRPKVLDDIDFYIKLFQPNTQSILELCCGTGRITIPLAQSGFSVDGLDLSEEMLSVFKQKLDNQSDAIKNRISLHKQNMIDFTINKKFDVIFIPFSSFQALTEQEDIVSFLACVKNHLNKNGRFVVHVFNPYQTMDETWKYAEKLDLEMKDGGKIIKRFSKGVDIDVEHQMIYSDLRYEITEHNTTENYFESLKLKYYYPKQLFDVLTNNGFEIINKYGYYDFSPFDEATSTDIIAECKLN